MNKKNIQLVAEVVNMVTNIKPRFFINLVIILVVLWFIYQAIGKDINCIGICFR